MRLLGLPTLVCAALVLLGSPAHGLGVDGSWRADDAAGDAIAHSFSPDPPPCGTRTQSPTTVGDVRSLGVHHAPRAVRVHLAATSLDARDTSISVDLRTPGGFLVLHLSPRRSGEGLRATLLERHGRPRPPRTDECGEYGTWFAGVRCPDMAATSRGVRLRLVVPRSCLDDPRWVRAGATLWTGPGDADVTVDRWAPVAADDTPWWRPVLGPRVRVAR